VADEQLSANFKRSEFACSCGCGYSTPDPHLVEALQSLRDSIGKPVVILSGCRCAARNAAVGGAVHSQHVLGKAADIRVPGLTARKIYDAVACIPELHGFGVSDEAAFVHVDVRETPAKWCYLHGSEAPWHEAPGTSA
jgi:uncharacterized protein YcbK (DUF882 family)